MDLKQFIVKDNHSAEYLKAIEWLDDRIGGEDDSIQAAWVGQYKNRSKFEEKLGSSLWEYAKINSLDYSSFEDNVWEVMELIYVEVRGYISDKIFTE
jgi:hypothetical protein